MNRRECLEEATKIVTTDREEQYGSPEDNFALIASLWTLYFSYELCISTEDVVNMMILLKVARNATGTGKVDNYVDIAGYAACGAELMEKKGE